MFANFHCKMARNQKCYAHVDLRLSLTMNSRFEPRQFFAALGQGNGCVRRVAQRARKESFKASDLWDSPPIPLGFGFTLSRPLLVVFELIIAGLCVASIACANLSLLELVDGAWVAELFAGFLIIAWLLLRRFWKVADKIIRLLEPSLINLLVIQQPAPSYSFFSSSLRGIFKPPRHFSFAH